jgi:hypothetical protein
MARRRRLALLAQYDQAEERNSEWHAARKRQLENVVEAEKQIKDSDTGDSQLVSRKVSNFEFEARLGEPEICEFTTKRRPLYPTFHCSTRIATLTNTSSLTS